MRAYPYSTVTRVQPVVASLLIVFGLSLAAAGQTVPSKPPAEDLTVETVKARQKEVDESQTLDAPTKDKLRGLFEQALKDLASAKNFAEAADRFERMAAAAPEELRKTKAELESLPRQPVVSIPEASVRQLEQTLSQKESSLQALKKSLTEIEAEPKRGAARRVEVPKRSATIRERLAELEKQLPPAGAADPTVAARRIALLAQRRAIEAELASYENELKAYDARAELLPLRRDVAARGITLAEVEIAKWREAINARRQREADEQVRRAQREARLAHPAVAKLTRTNATLAERRKEVAQLIVQTTNHLKDTNQGLTVVQDQFKRLEKNVEKVRLTNTIGLLLRKQREMLPDLGSHHAESDARQVFISDSRWEWEQLDERRRELGDLDAEVDKTLSAVGQVQYGGDVRELEAEVRAALQTEKEYTDALMTDLNTYMDKLGYLDLAETELIGETEKCAKFIDERVLWIRSTSALGLATLPQVAQGAAWFAQPSAWLDTLSGLWRDAKANPLLPAAFLALFAPLVWSRRKLSRKITAIGQSAGRATCCSLVPTLEAILFSTLIAIVWPSLFGLVAWRWYAASLDFSKAVGAGLAYALGIYLVLELSRQMCRNGGLAEAHFEWPAAALRPLRRYLRMATILVLPCVFVAVTLDAQQENDRWSDSLGRICFIAAMLLCAMLVQQSLRFNGGIYQALLPAGPSGWLARLRPLWYPAVVLLPAALAILAAAGYYYTAEQLARRMVTSAYILLAIVLLHSLLLRGILMRRRKLAMVQARQRRLAAHQPDAKPTGESAVILAPAEPSLDLAAINTQTRHLIEYALAVTACLGMWLAWVDVLPALGILNQISLWPFGEQPNPLTLADAFVATLIVATTLIAVKNIAGLLEMTLLQHLPLDTGLRYTIVAVARYAIIVVGMVMACNCLGLGWNKVQWLVAAVSVGLGFGLQEIFANFVSGLIILFERPVRVGDVVTVGDVTGVISRIRMRATTIVNGDRKEYIVPNKDFITGRLMNWTLTDKVNRVVINVGIAYGSDTSLAANLIMKTAQEHPFVLDDPAPRVTLEEFGASSLDFVLRCFLPDMDHRQQVIHDLHMTIDAEFRRAGIEIASPQQDIRIRSIAVDQEVLDRALAIGASKPRVSQADADDAAGDRRVA